MSNNCNQSYKLDYREIVDSIVAKSRENIDHLIQKYSDNRYVLTRLNNYLTNMPTMLENDYAAHIKRRDQAYRISETIRSVADDYIDANNYYYCSSSEIYFKYDSTHYFTYRDDTILYEIANLVNRDPVLSNYKYRVRHTILREIRERNILDSIPDTATIQIVVNSLLPLFLNNKTYVKYFLTVLGDIILKKDDDYTYLLDTSFKRFIKMLSDLAYQYFGSNNFTNIKYGYHEVQRNCRIIYADKNILINRYNNTIPNLLNNLECKNNNNFLDLFIVGVYYSNRYESSDGFLSSHDCELCVKTTVFILDDINHIIRDFITQTFQPFINDTTNIDDDNTNTNNTNNTKITNRNMNYLWRLYLSDNNLPNINFIANIKSGIRELVVYNAEIGIYTGVTSRKLPLIGNFLEFWNTTMEYREDNPIEGNLIEGNENEDYEISQTLIGLEISEIVGLFKYWLQLNNRSITGFSITETTVIDLILYYYDNIQIEDDKYISNIYSKLWNKNHSIMDFYNYYRDEYKTHTSSNSKSQTSKSLITKRPTANALYTLYCKWSKDTEKKFVVSKYYFLKFMETHII